MTTDYNQTDVILPTTKSTNYDNINIFHVYLNFGAVYDIKIYVNVCDVVCVVLCCLFLTSGCCLLCCDVVGVWGVVIFVLSVMRVVGGVPLWVGCVFRRVDVVCLCLWYTQLLF